MYQGLIEESLDGVEDSACAVIYGKAHNNSKYYVSLVKSP